MNTLSTGRLARVRLSLRLSTALLALSLHCTSTLAQSGNFPSCYRDLLSDACGYELWLHRQLDTLRSDIDADARQRRDDRDFLLWVEREYGVNLNYPYPLPRRRPK